MPPGLVQLKHFAKRIAAYPRDFTALQQRRMKLCGNSDTVAGPKAAWPVTKMSELIAAHRAKVESFLATKTIEDLGLKEQEIVIVDEKLTPVDGFDFLASKQAIIYKHTNIFNSELMTEFFLVAESMSSPFFLWKRNYWHSRPS